MLALWPGTQPSGLAGVDSHHQPAAAAHRYRHVTADEEGQAADGEILVFLDSYSCLGTDQLTHPIGKILVVGHGATIMPMQRAGR